MENSFIPFIMIFLVVVVLIFMALDAPNSGEVLFAAALGVVLSLGLFKVLTSDAKEEARAVRELIDECEANLTRTQKCKLIAVPDVDTPTRSE